MIESMTNRLLAGILVGIIIWLITNAAGFLLQRYRLERALIEDIKHRITNFRDAGEFIEIFFRDHVKEGSTLSYFPVMVKQGFPFFEDVRKDLFKYFGANNLIAIMRCYEAFEEIEVLLVSISENFRGYGKDTLSGDDITFLNRKKERILKIISILEKGELRKVNDIPRDYKGMMSAVDVIRR